MKGWLLDAYPSGDKMVFWLKQEGGNDGHGKCARFEDSWTHSIYLAVDDKADFNTILQCPQCRQYIKNHKLVQKYERITDAEMSWVLRLTLTESTKALKLAREIESHGSRFGKFRLYNVDLLPAQAYFYENELFPLAFCEVVSGSPHLQWKLLDDVEATQYAIPNFRMMEIDVKLRKEEEGKLPKFTDRLDAIRIKTTNEKKKEEAYEITGNSEVDILKGLENEVAKFDPDLVFTDEGDSFIFPYLIHRASENGINNLSLSRENAIILKRPSKEGTSYFSYGKIHFKPSSVKLHGRIHIDISNSFSISSAGLYGLYEVTRICRMPLHTSSRASIGKCLSSLQFYQAFKNGKLIPWKPDLAEHFKTYGELLVADRGGFVFEPRMGVYEKVAEFDFASLYPSIMYQKNISAETVRCECCPNSKQRVPELGYNICEKRRGIVPEAIKIVLTKRAAYKILRKNAKNTEERAIYDARQNALKWINVATFGYLGFNNAKFGRIDAHIAICSFDRQIFLQATRIVESEGFRVLHGIVDSLWLQKADAPNDDYLKLKQRIEKETEFEISFEGVYNWIAFLESKESSSTSIMLPVANRYFGAFEDGSLKIRGIEARRHDTPTFFTKFQIEALRVMAKGQNIAAVKSLMPEIKRIFDRYSSEIRETRVNIEDLAFTKYLSKDAGQYQEERNTIENSSIIQLSEEGKQLKAGQALRYVITDYHQKDLRKRTVPLELVVNARTSYDAKRYVELLAAAADSLTKPFGYSVLSEPL